MSWAMIWYRDAGGNLKRSFRTAYDESKGILPYDEARGIFNLEDHEAMRAAYQKNPLVKPELVVIQVPKSAVEFCNVEARDLWKLTDIPCCVSGYGVDVKAYFLCKELKQEKEAGDLKPPRYAVWRDQLIDDFEKNGPSLDSLKAAYPNIKEW